MSEQTPFFVAYDEPLTAEDRTALESRRWRVYENGIGVSAAWRVGNEPPPDFTMSQVVKVPASSPDEAKRLVVDALGREPENLRASP